MCIIIENQLICHHSQYIVAHVCDAVRSSTSNAEGPIDLSTVCPSPQHGATRTTAVCEACYEDLLESMYLDMCQPCRQILHRMVEEQDTELQDAQAQDAEMQESRSQEAELQESESQVSGQEIAEDRSIPNHASNAE